MNQEKLASKQQSQQNVFISPDTLPLVVGVDLGGTQIRAAVLQGATLLSRAGLLTGADTTPESVIPRMIQAVNQAIAEASTNG